MSAQSCPRCRMAIPDSDANDVTAIAFCRNCNLSYALRDLKPAADAVPSANLDSPPPGAWYHDDGHQKRIGATCRAPSRAFSAGLVALPWCAAVLLLIGVALVSTLVSFGVRTPAWIPVQMHEIGAKSGGCMVVIMWLFALVFALLGLGKLWNFFLLCGGSVEIVMADAVGGVTTSVCGVGRRKPFNPSRVKSVSIEQVAFSRKGKRYHRPIIVLKPEDGPAIRFGLPLREDRLEFVVAALNQALRRDVAKPGRRR